MQRTICLALLLVIFGSAAGYPSASRQVKGIIINTGESSIEIKKGRKEFVLYWADTTKVLFRGKEADRGSVEICQRAVANYAVKDGRNELVSLEIIGESYCKK